MSTNPKELNPIEASKIVIEKSKRSTDRTLRALQQEMEQENTLVQDTPNTRLQKVLKIYRGIKPVFAVIGSLPLIPSTWRAAIVMFTQALDALTAVGGEITAKKFVVSSIATARCSARMPHPPALASHPLHARTAMRPPYSQATGAPLPPARVARASPTTRPPAALAVTRPLPIASCG
jgi:hypothetical protein